MDLLLKISKNGLKPLKLVHFCDKHCRGHPSPTGVLTACEGHGAGFSPALEVELCPQGVFSLCLLRSP